MFDDKDQNNSNQETEKVIPIMGEEVVVSGRTVKIGEIVIKKSYWQWENQDRY